jgi:hypothetical protein
MFRREGPLNPERMRRTKTAKQTRRPFGCSAGFFRLKALMTKGNVHTHHTERITEVDNESITKVL